MSFVPPIEAELAISLSEVLGPRVKAKVPPPGALSAPIVRLLPFRYTVPANDNEFVLAPNAVALAAFTVVPTPIVVPPV
jgi:hypothetical protein